MVGALGRQRRVRRPAWLPSSTHAGVSAVPDRSAANSPSTASATSSSAAAGSSAWATSQAASFSAASGYLMAAADSTAAVCAHLNRPAGAEGTTTLESKTNFVGAVTGGIVRWTAEPVHVGRSTIVVQTDARDEAGALVSRSLQTQAVLHAAR